MTKEDELFEKVKLLNQQNQELYEKHCALLKDKVRNADVDMMKAIVHNKVLLMVILSKLGMEDDEIDKLNVTIYDALEKSIEEYLNGNKDEKEETRN